jgi:septal ring factor EnvC (AmiA/AmiB activator)
MARANEQLRAEAAELKQRIQALEQENRRLSEANEVVTRDIGQVSECCPKVKKDMTNLGRELAKLKEEIKRMKGTQDPLVEAVGQLKGQLARVEAGQEGCSADPQTDAQVRTNCRGDSEETRFAVMRGNSAAANCEHLIWPPNGKIVMLDTLNNQLEPVKRCPEVVGQRGRGVERLRFIAINFNCFSYCTSYSLL